VLLPLWRLQLLLSEWVYKVARRWPTSACAAAAAAAAAGDLDEAGSPPEPAELQLM
jgi:hypothetical protein